VGVDHLVSGFDSALSVASMCSSFGFNNIKVVQDWYNKIERIFMVSSVRFPSATGTLLSL